MNTARRKSVTSPSILPSAILVICLFASFAPGLGVRAEGMRPNILRCQLTDADTLWIQRALDAWGQVSRDFLRLDPKPLPWIVLFDDACTWHLNPQVASLPSGSRPVETSLSFAGDQFPVHAVPHGGTVRFPNGSAVPAEVMAAAFPYDDGESSFYALALLDLWRKHPQASQDPHLEERILSVTLHEMVHTRQLPHIGRRVAALGRRYDLPQQINDDVIETRFRGVPGFREAFEAERDLLYRAVAEPRPARRRALVARALAMAKNRRTRFFGGANKPYAELEELFLNMEGVAEWTRFKFHQARQQPPRSDVQIMDFLRGRKNDWAQDEGLALFLLLEKLGSRWQSKVLGPGLASPFALLESALKRPAQRSASRTSRARPEQSFDTPRMTQPEGMGWRE
jgi:hypothetical protein